MLMPLIGLPFDGLEFKLLSSVQMLRGHSDDVSRFVVSEGMVVSGGRDRSICGWSARTGEFLFARYSTPGSSSSPGIVQ